MPLNADRLFIVSDSRDSAEDIRRHLGGMFESQFFPRYGLPHATPTKYTIVDLDLTDGSYLSDLRLWLQRRPKDGKAIFAVEQGVLRQAVQAYAVGATDVLDRPLNRKMILTNILGDIESLIGISADLLNQSSEGVRAAAVALQSIWASVVSGTRVELNAVHAAGDVLVSDIEGEGLAHWIDVVRKHHSQTYQHCLLVTGVAVAFGRHLGFSSVDKQKLAFGGLLHDCGKAGVPVALLEKPAPLDSREAAVMRRHPQLGFDALRQADGIDPSVLDMVVHHHEYLDGSGYPHGLQAPELSDLVRMMTIADIYGALIERRAYKAPMTCEAAYQVLKDMGSKLDTDLVREFQPISRMQARALL